MLSCAKGTLKGLELPLSPLTALCVVIAAKGYPGDYPRGMAISGLNEAEGLAEAAPDQAEGLAEAARIKVFQAGTRVDNGQVVSSGGRILGVTAMGQNLAAAKELAYQALGKVKMDKMHYRTDIGDKGLRRG